MQAGKKTIFSLLFSTIFFIAAQAQTIKLSGKVLNEKNEPLSSVSIKISGTNTGTTTDIEGRFLLNLSSGKKYQLDISAVGYETKTVTDVEVVSGQVNELNVTLQLKTTSGDNVIITSKSSARKETINSAISFQKNTNTVAQIISSEAIRRSPDKNTGEVLKRVPGTSIQEGKYLVVRGLSDRYNQAMLNGILLSSTEPDRKTFSFDIFPSAMIDNIIINKAFVPEFPGEWAGGLVQVNTKDVPSSDFMNIQIGTGFNTQTIGKDFYTYSGGKTDWLGFEDGTRGLPASFPLKSKFNALSRAEKANLGKQLENVWSSSTTNNNFFSALNTNLQISGGMNRNLGKKNKLGTVLALTYNRSNKRLDYNNAFFGVQNGIASLNFDYNNQKYSQDILAGALGNITLQLGNNHKISFKNILNVNTSDYVTRRTGKDFESDPINGENIRASELAFKSNTFFNTQLSGDHNLPSIKSKFHWYGSFNILDQYVPDQRRVQYNQNVTAGSNQPYYLLISNTRSQKTGSRYFGYLSDYIYTAGADAAKNFLLSKMTQSVKVGYMLQVKDRLFDSRPFSIYLPTDNSNLRLLTEDKVFDPANFGDGTGNKFGFDEIAGNQYRYLANSILNAAFIQFDNQITNNLRAVWGVRMENFDQLIGSVRKSDPRFVNNEKLDFLPGVNITYKLNNKTNIRLSGSQTVIRPEFRELTNFAFFDFELGATVLGNPSLNRTKVTNADLRYEVYPRAGELFTIGVFYKYFKQPIELYFNQSGVGTSNTFNYVQPEQATAFGAELEFRKKLDMVNTFKNFTVQGNLSYIYNRVKSLDRPMQGQSPYLVNLGLQYDHEKSGLATTLLFNQIGRRILFVGNQDIPAIWEAPRPLLDLQIAKKLMKKKGELRLNVSDIFNRRAYFYHDIDNNKKYVKGSADALAINRKYGSNISLSFTYNIK